MAQCYVSHTKDKSHYSLLLSRKMDALIKNDCRVSLMISPTSKLIRLAFNEYV